MAYKVVYKKSVERDLKNRAKADAEKILDQIEGELSSRPEASPILKGHFAGLRKYRVGDYRVIYAIIGGDVLILRIGHRREVYRRKIRG